MKLDFDENSQSMSISSYSSDGIVVGGRLLTSPFVIAGNEILLGSLPANVTDIDASHISSLVDLKQHIILLGTGATQLLLDGSCMRPALEAQVGLEVMTTPAACRSFNVLLAENRAVVGAFYMP